jgi:Flp pilus assembly protein TadD
MTLALLLMLFQAPDLLDQAEAAFRNGDAARAESLARQAVTRDPNSPAGHMILGVISAQRQNWVEATRQFEAVIRLVPADPNGYFYLGQAHLYQKRWASAAKLLRQALDRNYPDRDRLLIELAYAENEAGDPAKALKTLDAVKISGAEAGAQFYAVAGFANARLLRFPEALDAMSKARDLDPANSQYWEFIISTLISTDQTPAALREAIRAQAKFPDSGEVQYLFALASYYVVESPLSGLALRNLREAEPESPRVLLAEGLLYRKQGKNAEATQSFLKAAQKGVPDSHLLLAILYRENGDMVAAEREYREAEKANPANGQIQLELGKAALTRGAVPEATGRLEKAVAMMPSNSSAHYQLGLAYGRAGKRELSTEHLNLSRELDRRQAELQKGPKP